MFVENLEERRSSDVGRKSPTEVVAELQKAINQHDLDAMMACFAPEYESEFPAHPNRTFRGNEQMHKNWSQIFATVPDIEAVLLHCISDGDTVWAEWEWRGTRIDGTRHLMRGVTVQGVKQDRIAWVRLYMEPVQVGAGTDAAIRERMPADKLPEEPVAGQLGGRSE